MFAQRIKSLPPYLFAAIDSAKNEAKKRGVDIIDLGVGDPDLPTPPHIIEALCNAARDPRHHRYPSYEGMQIFREAVSKWYHNTFKVNLNPDEEVIALIGSKEGIAHAPLAFLDPGDTALVPDPAYPVYSTAVTFAGGKPYILPLKAENGFLPDLEAIPREKVREAKIMFLNYPNNPTSATASPEFFRELVDFALDNNIFLLHDNPYSEMTFDGYRAPSLLETKNAKEVALEFHSLSKTYNMTGWRVGFAVGNPELIKGLGKVKTNIDSGIFEAVQMAGIAALTGPQDCVAEMRKTYQERRDTLLPGLLELGLQVTPPKATFYVWAGIKGSSLECSKTLLEKAGIVATPGIGFGSHGEGYLRFALTQPVERIQEAVERMKKLQI